MKRLLALVVLGAVVPCCCKRHPQSTQSPQSPADAGVPAAVESVSRDSVARIAREYCKGLLEIPTDCVPTVEETFATFTVVFLVKYDETKKAIQHIVDMPDRQIDLFIRFCLQKNGRLSARKRGSNFDFLSVDDVACLEQAIQAVYGRRKPDG